MYLYSQDTIVIHVAPQGESVTSQWMPPDAFQKHLRPWMSSIQLWFICAEAELQARGVLTYIPIQKVLPIQWTQNKALCFRPCGEQWSYCCRVPLSRPWLGVLKLAVARIQVKTMRREWWVKKHEARGRTDFRVDKKKDEVKYSDQVLTLSANKKKKRETVDCRDEFLYVMNQSENDFEIITFKSSRASCVRRVSSRVSRTDVYGHVTWRIERVHRRCPFVCSNIM